MGRDSPRVSGPFFGSPLISTIHSGLLRPLQLFHALQTGILEFAPTSPYQCQTSSTCSTPRIAPRLLPYIYIYVGFFFVFISPATSTSFHYPFIHFLFFSFLFFLFFSVAFSAHVRLSRLIKRIPRTGHVSRINRICCRTREIIRVANGNCSGDLTFKNVRGRGSNYTNSNTSVLRRDDFEDDCNETVL